jgi:non-specific serine/threonine protein kinase
MTFLQPSGRVVCPVLVGRDDLLALAERRLSEARRGAGRMLFLAGEPLTVREYEVAELIADGLTNAQIAASLGVALRTVSAHVEHILAKLAASRRAEVAAWVAHRSARDQPSRREMS